MLRKLAILAVVLTSACAVYAGEIGTPERPWPRKPPAPLCPPPLVVGPRGTCVMYPNDPPVPTFPPKSPPPAHTPERKPPTRHSFSLQLITH